MTRITITIDENLYKALRKIQGGFISSTGEDWSFTTIVNLIILAGIIAPEYLDEELKEEFWETLRDFIKDKKIELELSGIEDKIVEKILEEVKKL